VGGIPIVGEQKLFQANVFENWQAFPEKPKDDSHQAGHREQRCRVGDCLETLFLKSLHFFLPQNGSRSSRVNGGFIGRFLAKTI